MKARFAIPFADFDYVGLARPCGIIQIATKTNADGRLELHVEGPEDAITSLSRDLGYRPEEISA